MSASRSFMETTPDAIPSTAAVHGHPIHPMLVSFPIAFLVGALLTDCLFLWRDALFWATASYWLLSAGLMMGAVAAIFGIADFFGDRRIRAKTVARLHFGGNAIVLVLTAVNLAMRDSATAEGLYPTGLVLSLVVVLLLCVTGWLGGEMAYRHRVGVVPRPGGLPREHGD